MLDAAFIGIPDDPSFHVPSKHYLDLNGSVRINDRFQIRLGVNNVTNTQPPIFQSFDQSNTLPSVYDVLGRSFYVGANAHF